MKEINRKIFLIIPAFNEEENIIKLLDTIFKHPLKSKINIIFVDDGSVDKTLHLAKKYSNKLKMKFIKHKTNLGIPRAFYESLLEASKVASDNDVIIIIEADNTSDIKLFSSMLKKINRGNDVIIASRYIKGGGYKNFPFQRELGSKLINYILKFFFYTKNVTDYTIFFRAYTARVIKSGLKKYGKNFIQTNSFVANLEILLRVREFSRGFSEVPLIYDYGLKKGKSKMKITKTLFEYKNIIIKRLFGRI